MKFDLTTWPDPANYTAVSFKGANFMCVEGSPRETWLREANQAWLMGYEDLCRSLFDVAMTKDGCPFEHHAQGIDHG